MGNLESTLSLTKCQTTAAYSVQIKSVLDKRHFNVNNVNVGSIALVILTFYNQRDDVFKFLRQVMALPFLPQEHIVETFLQLDQLAPDAIIPVMDYVYSTWISNSVFKVHQWSVFMSPVRTNNDVEGWHNRFNSNVVTRGPVPFYHLVTKLYAESTDIPIQLKLISEGELKRYKRKRSRQIPGQIFGLWGQYVRREITASQLLRECAFVYGPPAQ